MRRGLQQATRVVVLGDGAPWIWNLATERFPDAVHVVDLYHAREHFAGLGKLVYGVGSAEARAWTAAHCDDLDEGQVDAVVYVIGHLPTTTQAAREQVRKDIDYFQTNALRTCYRGLRNQGFFVGSGAIEAGCKAVVGHRVEQSGMRWTVDGANAIIALRCGLLSDRWEELDKPRRELVAPTNLSHTRTRGVPAVGPSGVLASSALPLCGVATRVKHGDNDNDVRFDGEVCCVRKPPEKRPTDAVA